MSFEEDQDGSFTTYLAEGDKVRVPVRVGQSTDQTGPGSWTVAPVLAENDRLF